MFLGNMLRTLWLSLLIMIFSFSSLQGEPMAMSGKGLEAAIREFADKENLSVNGNVIEFVYESVPLICIYDEAHNRMRIISPICEYAEVSDVQRDRMMESNFHSALDARYASSHGVLYSAYVHPLGSMTEADVLSAIYQVVSLHLSFGTSYSSGILKFGDDSSADDLT